jgi:transcriptional regulator with XRE-family HTH domain
MAKPPKHRRVGQADKDIGQRIRLRRVEVGMSQQTLAEVLGLAFQQVQKYEIGINRVTAPRLQQIATALCVPISFFYDAAKGSEKQQEVESLLALDATLGLRLVRAYRSIKSRSLQRNLVALTEALAHHKST